MQPTFARRFAHVIIVLALFGIPSVRGDEPVPPADAVGGEVVRCPIEGDIRIVELKRSGTHVKKGELLCELDTLHLRERFVNVQIDLNRATADYLNAKLTREVAEITSQEQEEAVIPSDLLQKQSAVSFAKKELAVALQLVSEAKTQAERTQADASVTKGKARLEEAEMDLNTFKTLTIPKRRKELQSSLVKAKTDESVKLTTKDEVEKRVKHLKSQIDQCRIVAPSDGRIVHLAPTADDVALGLDPIDEGTMVRERQTLFWFVPDVPAPKPKSPAGK